MSNKFQKILGILFVGLLAVVVFPHLGFGKKEEPKVNFFEGFGKDSVEEIFIESGSSGAVLLTKTNGLWEFDGRKVGDSQIAQLLLAFENTEILDPVSLNSENHERLGISEERGYKLNITKGGEVFEFFVGGRTPDMQKYYVRKANEDTVYMATGDLRPLVIRSKDVWWDKIVAAVPFASVGKVEVSSSVNFEVVKKDDGTWVKSLWGTETELEEDAKTSLGSVFSPLRGSRFLGEAELAEFNNDFYKDSIKIYDAGGNILANLAVSHRNEGIYWVQNMEPNPESIGDVMEITGLEFLFGL
jgi:hypothetical protein